MQEFVPWPSDKLDGIYKVARWNKTTSKYEELPTSYLSEADAFNAAEQFNKEYKEELTLEYEYEHQDELIDKYHGFANSPDIQKQNAAKEFFDRFPFQRDVCEQIKKEIEEARK